MQASLLALALAATAFAAPLPAASAAPTPPVQASVGGLRLPPPKAGRARPLVAVVAGEQGAETTDFLVPLGLLRRSGLAEVRAVAVAPGPVQLLRNIRIQPDATLAEFDRAAPEGADIVIVPAQGKPDSPALIAWLQAQAAKGATVVSICEGARVLAAAGLLDGRRATTHWGALNELSKSHPRTVWVRDRRYVQDGPIISTTGVAASVPVSLALIEAIGGPAAARREADRIGVADWTAGHRTADFALTFGDYARAIGSLLAVWTHETAEAPVSDGVDEVALALRVDAWGRTFRTHILTTSPGPAPVRSRDGLVILPAAAPEPGRFVLPSADARAGAQISESLAGIRRRYGAGAARLAVLGMEIDAPASSPAG